MMFRFSLDEIDLIILKEIFKLGDRANANKIYMKTPLSYPTIARRVKKLIGYGLLVESGEKSGRRLALTKKGLQILEMFQ